MQHTIFPYFLSYKTINLNITSVKKIFVYSFFVFLFQSLALQAQLSKNQVKLNWTGIKTETGSDSISRSFLTLDGGIYENPNTFTPIYILKDENLNSDNFIPELNDFKFEELNPLEIALINNPNLLKNNIETEAIVSYEKKKAIAIIKINPFRINPLNNKIEKLVSFSYQLKTSASSQTGNSAEKSYTFASNSVLSTGNWVKLAVKQTGMYKITFADLAAMGINTNNLQTNQISIFGNTAGMLPEANNLCKYDDLNELAIIVKDINNNGIFDQTDYIVFYGQSPVVWKYNSNKGLFEHQINYYSDQSYYFLTTASNIGVKKRISIQNEPTAAANYQIKSFIDYAYYHKELENLAKSGKNWVGEKFNSLIYNYNYPFNFPNIIADSAFTLKYSLLAASPVQSNFILNLNGNTKTIDFPICIPSYSGNLAINKIDYFKVNNINNPVNLNISYNHPATTSNGWLNYVEVNAYRKLQFSGNQMSFRTTQGYGSGNISEFIFSNPVNNISILDVTNPLNVRYVDLKSSDFNLSFKITTDTLREFIAYDESGFYKAEYAGLVQNQNLHGFSQQDYIIVSNPLFIVDALRLAQFHERSNHLKVKVVTPEMIYNEFSTGLQDPMAIRNFMRMFYNRASDSNDMPKYLLLFGDASYDFKDRYENNSNMIVTYETDVSFEGSTSYATDDFFGFLDENETGLNSYESLDIGIGRFPVRTTEEGKIAVDKILRYTSYTDLSKNSNTIISNYADWRNSVCLVSDDEDGNIYVNDTELFYNKLKNNNKVINVDKVYFDSYPQISNAGGQRYPDATDAINQRVEKGSLIVNYIGHGGELGWAHERVLQISDILKWKNNNNMPLFFTATCEFSRYDDPKMTSAGELVFLNANGGGIALLTTSRLAYQAPNMVLNNSFFNNVFVKKNGKYPTLGDLMRISKNDAGNNYAIRNFVLLGDPALRLAYPRYNVVTTHVNGKSVDSNNDTIQAMSTVTIKGIITDENQNKMNYNGVLYPTIYDKPMIVKTLANDPGSYQSNFELAKAILYKGKASIVNGDFEFTFVVPKDIAYYYGYGKISYYAKNDTSDANGFYDKLIVGGYNQSVIPDETGPKIKLYMNDTNFIFRGMTDENPILLAKISDATGINTVGNGIGHDIVAYFDGHETKPLILNDYYVSDIDKFNQGTVYYPFFNLSDGLHSIKVKVWDVFNNSAEDYTEFIVSKSAQLVINNLLNYPNPFSSSTSFVFEHNQADTELDVQIQIFDMAGKLIKTLSEKIMSGGYKTEPITWNGTSDSGADISKGLYIYRLTVTKQNGDQVVKTNKLVFLR